MYDNDSDEGLNFSQQQNLFDPKRARKVHVIGAGSVGSLVVNQLARIGASDITVWDDDSVDSHNVGPSLYGQNDVGYYKVDRLRAIIERTTGVRITGLQEKYVGTPLKGSVICCVDTMEARQCIWRAVQKKLFVNVLIDTRTAERFVQVFATRPCKQEDIAHYEQFLAYPTTEAARQQCGEHSIIFVAARAASIAVEALSDFWASGRTEFMRLEQLGSDVFIHPKQE
jgi:ThiF family